MEAKRERKKAIHDSKNEFIGTFEIVRFLQIFAALYIFVFCKNFPNYSVIIVLASSKIIKDEIEVPAILTYRNDFYTR